MAYEPRKRIYHIRWKIVLPLLLLIVLLLYASVSLIVRKQKTIDHFSVCGFTSEKTVEVLNKKTAEVIEMKDYLYYGESLGLYNQTYAPENKDVLAGKTVILENVCDGKETTLTMENTADQKINLQKVQPGFYTVTVIDNLVKKRVVFQDVLKENRFQTVVRDGKVNEITLIANKNLLQDQEVMMDKNYLFLEVESKDAEKDKVDVLLDPYGMNTDVTYTPDVGAEANGLVENDEMFDAAVKLKKELESYGLRVAITKNSKDEVITTYGEDGRLSKGYTKDAKYYILMRFNNNTLNAESSGFEIWHSAYSSPNVARNTMYSMKKDNSITPSSMYYDDYNWPGVVSSNLTTGLLDGKAIYDTNMWLRESGGRATLTSLYSESSKEANSSFASANGMLGMEVDFAYISNEADATHWKNNKDSIITSFAKAYVQAIKVEK